MWSAFGEELAILLSADRIRIRRFVRWPKRFLFETEAPISANSEAVAEQWSSSIQLALSPRVRTAKLFVAEDLCRLGWVSMPQQKLSAAEVDALVRSQSARDERAGMDVNIVFDATLSSGGAVFATVDRALLLHVADVLKRLGLRLTSATPATAAIVSKWLNLPLRGAAGQRHLLIVDDRTTYVFTSINGELSNVKRLPASTQSDTLAARVASTRISLELADGNNDVLMTPPFSKMHDGSPAFGQQGRITDFADLYTSPNDV